MKFSEVANSFAVLEKTASRTHMTQELAHVLQQATAQEALYISYMVLGTLNPPYISTQFAIAQKSMIKIIARLVNLSDEIIEQAVVRIGDCGAVVEEYVWHTNHDLTITQVYRALQDIEKIAGVGSQEEKITKTYELLSQVDVVSAKYIIRIILGKLRLGFSDMTLLDAFSWMYTGDKSARKTLEQAYNVCADSGLLAQTLKEFGIASVEAMRIHIGIPIRPAAAERLPDAKAIIEKIGVSVAQPKLDGFRLQVHVDLTQDKPLIRFFSRNLLDMSEMFPEFVTACKKFPIKNIILDAEAIVYDPNTHTFLSFQETVKRKRKHGIDALVSELPLQLNIFDIMYHNGHSLLDVTQKERRMLLEKIFAQNTDKSIRIIDQKKVHTAHELEQYFIQEIAAGLEGVVVKKQDSLYQAGKRSFNWIKLKYQASDKLQDTLDVVILGYYPGQGKRAHFGIGAFLIGIYNQEVGQFQTVAKIGTGLTDDEWRLLKSKCDMLALKECPKNVFCTKELVPLVWVSPEIVCEVLADEITLSPQHTAGKTDNNLGVALRFPRFVKYRDDKSAFHTTTLQELQHLRTMKI